GRSPPPRRLDMSRFAWPFPKDLSLLDTLVLVQRWKAILYARGVDPKSETFNAKDGDVEDLAKLFLEAVVCTMTCEPSRAPDEQPLDWLDIAKKVVALSERNGTSGREDVGRTWALGRAGLLAAPESGLPDTVAKTWLEALCAARNDLA